MTHAPRLLGVPNIDQARSGPARALLGVLLAAPFLSQVDATIANVAPPAIRISLGASGATAKLGMAAFAVTSLSIVR
jgi:hypothetical protein